MTIPLSPAFRRAADQILAAVRRHRSFFLTGHERPDGDTVGCQLGFAGFLKRRGKKVTIVNSTPLPKFLEFLPGIESIQTAAHHPGKFDCAVVFECSGPERMGNVIDLGRQAKMVINIDHHLHHGNFGHINLVDPKASSNSEQVYLIMERAKHKVSAEEATALYAGLVTDTGKFQQENTTTQSHAVAMKLLAAGVNVAEVYRHLFATRTVPTLQLLGRALAGIRLEHKGRVAVMTASAQDFRDTGAGEDDVEDVVNHGLMPPTTEACVFLRELQDGRVKVSLRGKGKVDLCALAVSFGGGGHRNASGATIDGPLAAAAARLLRALGEALP